MLLLKTTIVAIAGSIISSLFFCLHVEAQSRDMNFPTPVTSNEIVGMIKARDIGDSRLTGYYYAFGGDQGDIFINVVTKNFAGDIDVFMADGLKPLTKMVIFADASINETGRLIYLRKTERLLLRVEGRTPNDDPATFRIKFAGSFIVLSSTKPDAAPTLDPAGRSAANQPTVNSVGTIIEAPPKPKSRETSKEAKSENGGSTSSVNKNRTVAPDSEKIGTERAKASNQQDAAAVETKKMNSDPKSSSKPAIVANTPTKRTKNAPPVELEEKVPDPLSSIRLVIQLKDGKFIERPMNEVQRFSVDNGMLTVIGKNGSVMRHSILNVAKVTIE